MNQLLQSPAASRWLQKLLSTVGVATAVDLERARGLDEAGFRGRVLLGAADNSTLLASVPQAIAADQVEIYVQGGSSLAADIEQALDDSQQTLGRLNTEGEQVSEIKALIFDASGIRSSAQLDQLYSFFHKAIKQLQRCGRVVVLGRPPEDITDSKFHTAQRALEGFCRCLGKEVGRRGATVQLIYVGENAELGMAAPLQFFLSPRSAYVSAQVIRVSNPESSGLDSVGLCSLAGKVALVTGASRGIGEKIAQTLAADGARVIGLDIPPLAQELEAAMRRIGGSALVMDISDKQAPCTLAKYCLDNFSGLDIIVHNAGVTRDKTLANMPEHFWNMTVDINLTAQERINEQLLEQKVLHRGGRIVCVSSVSGIAGNFGQTNYGASKAGVIGMVESMAPQLRPQGITINAVAPGFIETQMTQAIPFLVREVGKRINALGQAGKPEDVANTISFLANPGSAMISGNVIRVCGQSMLGA